jgi:hypothetical protein
MRGQCLIPLKPTSVSSKSKAAAQHIGEVCPSAKPQSFTASEVRQIGPAFSALYPFSAAGATSRSFVGAAVLRKNILPGHPGNFENPYR